MSRFLPESRKLRAAILCGLFSFVAIQWLGLSQAEIAVVLGPVAAYIGSQSLMDRSVGGSTRGIVRRSDDGTPDNPYRKTDRDRLWWALLPSAGALVGVYLEAPPEHLQSVLIWIELHILGQGVARSGVEYQRDRVAGPSV